MTLTEKRFNRAFSIFLVAGMFTAEVIYTIMKIHAPALTPSSGTDLVITMMAMVAAMLGVINCVLSANGNIWTFIFGVVQVSLAAVINYENDFTGQFALHAFYYLPMQFIGFWQWHRRGAKTKMSSEEKAEGKTSQVKARRMTARQRIAWALICLVEVAAAYIILYYLDSQKLASGTIGSIDKTKVLLDSIVTALSIIGQILMSFAFMEQWVLWNVANIADVILWSLAVATPGGNSYAVVMLVMWVFYLPQFIEWIAYMA